MKIRFDDKPAFAAIAAVVVVLNVEQRKLNTETLLQDQSGLAEIVAGLSFMLFFQFVVGFGQKFQRQFAVVAGG